MACFADTKFLNIFFSTAEYIIVILLEITYKWSWVARYKNKSTDKGLKSY